MSYMGIVTTLLISYIIYSYFREGSFTSFYRQNVTSSGTILGDGNMLRECFIRKSIRKNEVFQRPQLRTYIIIYICKSMGLSMDLNDMIHKKWRHCGINRVLCEFFFFFNGSVSWMWRIQHGFFPWSSSCMECLGWNHLDGAIPSRSLAEAMTMAHLVRWFRVFRIHVWYIC